MITAKQAHTIATVDSFIDKDCYESCISWADTYIQKAAFVGKTEIHLMNDRAMNDLTPARAKRTREAIFKYLEEQGFTIKPVCSESIVDWYVSWDEVS